MILALLLGCPPDDGTLLGRCDRDPACEIARVIDAWPEDPDGVIAAINEHPIPEARIALVDGLITERPESIQPVCSAVSGPGVTQRCSQWVTRPHLWQTIRPAQPLQPRPGGGPSSTEIAPISTVTSRWASLTAAEDPCEEGANHTACLMEAAQAAAGRRKAQRAAALCLNIDSERWRGECMFLAAEAVLSRGAHGYADAVELCINAEPFSQNCHSHSLMLLAEDAPSAADGSPQAWRSHVTAANAIRTAWSWRDPQMATLAEDRLWSEITGRAYAGAHEVNGNPLAALPEAAWPHVRAAAVRQLVRTEGAGTYDLEGWVARAEQALAVRTTASARHTGGEFRAAPDLWPVDLPGEEQHPAVFYLGTGRRAVSEDVRTDLAICVLEAIWRSPPVAMSIMEQGAAHPDPLVAWTSTRLQEMREPAKE